MIDLVNDLRGLENESHEKIVWAHIAEEGAVIGGYVAAGGIEAIQRVGKISLGLPGPRRRSLFRHRGRTHITSRTTVDAVRGRGNAAGIEAGWQVVSEPTKTSIKGPKGTNLEPTHISDVQLGGFSSDVDEEAFEPIKPEDVTTKHMKSGWALRIDGNGFGNAIEGATENGQKNLIKDYDRFFKMFEGKLKGLPVIPGPGTGDSGIYYLENLITEDMVVLRAFQEALQEAIEEGNVSVKAVGFKIEDAKFTLINGRVAISNKNIPEEMWNKKEDDVKNDFANYMNPGNQSKLQSTVFIRDSNYRDMLLRGSRE